MRDIIIILPVKRFNTSILYSGCSPHVKITVRRWKRWN